MNTRGLRSLIQFSSSIMLATALLLLLWVAIAPVQAQVTNQIVVEKELGRANPVVRVGEYLTFTIRIQNQSQFTITTLPLSDNYNNAVLAFVDASVTPDSVDTAAGEIEWNDLTTTFGVLPPGAEITVIAGFIAEHPSPTVVNYAEVHDALADQGEVEGGGDESGEGESIGGAAPVDKNLIGDVIPEVGMPLTFTIAITNDAYTTMTAVSLIEDYDPEFLQFSYAVPPPDSLDEVNGELVWSDLTVWLGDLGPMAGFSVTAVFTALAPIDVTTNSAIVADAQDWYGNDMAAGADQVPITIIGPDQQQTPTPTATTTTQATATPSSSSGGGGGATSTPAAAATPAATASLIAQKMPETGIPPAPPLWPTLLLMGLALLLPVLIWFIWQRRRPS